MSNSEQIRYVTPEQFEIIMRIVRAPPANKRAAFASWFGDVLEVLWATGCRPSEIVGRAGRNGEEPEENGVSVSRIKDHHGLRPRDVLPDGMLYVEGKHISGIPGKRTTKLKPRNVLVANPDLHARLLAQAQGCVDQDANLFGLGPAPAIRSHRGHPDGYWLLMQEVKKLRRRLPPFLKAFGPKWLRHSHAINALRSGVDLVSLQRQLGHTELATTAIYLRYAPLDKERYINAFVNGSATVETVCCPACSHVWKRDTRNGRGVSDADPLGGGVPLVRR